MANKLKKNTIIPLCSCPSVLLAMGEKKANVVTEARTLRKIATIHNLTAKQTEEIVNRLDLPEYVLKDTETSYIFIPGVLAKNKSGIESDVEALCTRASPSA